MDGFVAALPPAGQRRHAGDGLLRRRDLPYYWNLADSYVLFDRFFSSAAAGSVRTTCYWVAGRRRASGASESLPTGGYGDMPTIFDRLEAAGRPVEVLRRRTTTRQ